MFFKLLSTHVPCQIVIVVTMKVHVNYVKMVIIRKMDNVTNVVIIVKYVKMEIVMVIFMMMMEDAAAADTWVKCQKSLLVWIPVRPDSSTTSV